MGATVQVRDLDGAVHEQLRRAAEREGLSLSAFLRRALTGLAADLELRERASGLNAAQGALGGPFPGLGHVTADEAVNLIREARDSR